MRKAVPIEGCVESRFAGVRDVFHENFKSHNELGGAVCVVVGGRAVVDLWGGHRDVLATRPWERDTLVDVFSVGKGLLAAGVARLVGRGAIDLDAPVATAWPAFAANDKGSVTMRHVLSHTAGLPAIRRRLAPGAMLSAPVMRDALAAEAPWWAPGTAHGYHVNTFGFLVGAVIERVTGRGIGEFLREEVTGPLDADLRVGLRGADLDRVAEFRWELVAPPESEPEGIEGMDLMRYNAYWNPSGLSGLGVVNTQAWRRCEHPSTNAHGTARGIARLYDALSRGGRLNGYELVSFDALDEATTESVVGDDLVLGRPSRFGLGFQLSQPSDRSAGPATGSATSGPAARSASATRWTLSRSPTSRATWGLGGRTRATAA